MQAPPGRGAAADPAVAAAAAGLLRWLDACAPNAVMAAVMQQVEASADTAAAVPVFLEVDVTLLTDEDAAVAASVIAATGQVERQAAAMINQQLAVMQQEQQQPEDAPGVSVDLQLALTRMPLPLLSVSEASLQAVRLCSRGQPLPLSVLGIVTGCGAPFEVVRTQRVQCQACGGLTDVRPDDTHLSCCSLPRNSWLKEDITGRVMARTQQLWLSDVSAATGLPAYGISRAPLVVSLPAHLVGCATLGDALHVTGHATIAGGSPACNIQVDASTAAPVLPHAMLWSLPGSAADAAALQEQQRSGQPLQHLWDLLTAALGYETPLDPHLAMCLLMSAAGVGGRQPAAAGPPEQINLLVLHQAGAPATPRLLRAAAALLSPQSVTMPVRFAQHVTPVSGGPDGGPMLLGAGTSADKAAATCIFASVLHSANAGVVATELALLPAKTRGQLLDALQQRATPAPRDLPPALTAPRVTATVWAAASIEDVCGLRGEAGSAGGGSRGKAAAAAGASSYHGFDLCVGDDTVHEDDLWELLGIEAAPAALRLRLQQAQDDAAGALRSLVAGAAACEQPVLSEAAQAFLGRWFLIARQSVDTGSHVSKPRLLASVLRVAAAVARLHRRRLVLETPDATLAVVLMEHSLMHKLGEAYRPLLDLPCDLITAGSQRSLDAQVGLLHGLIARVFRQHAGVGGDGDGSGGDDDDDDAAHHGGGGGWFGGGGGAGWEEEQQLGGGEDFEAALSGGVRQLFGGGAFLQPDSQVEQE